jgi:diaminopimelate decarboxylase
MVSTPPRVVEKSGRQYLQTVVSSPELRSPNQELLPLTAKVNSADRLEIGGCDGTAIWLTALYPG